MNRTAPFRLVVAALSLVIVTFAAPAARAAALSGYVAVDGFAFFNPPLQEDQKYYTGSVAIQPEFYHEFEGGSSVTVVPFARFDSADDERTHADLREFNFLYLAEDWELRIGVGKVFWGVIESVHLVDIINQTDTVEAIDGEEKLGQPMVNLSIPSRFGTFDFFVMPWFRERTFPGQGGRLRFDLLVDVDKAEYESADEERHVDFAVRYSNTIGGWEVGLSNFYGTGREPTYDVRVDESGRVTIIPFYPIINQAGLDVQYVIGSWLIKLETIYRQGQGDPFSATASGIEYTLFGLLETAWDVGLITEWIYDDRGDESPTPFDNDVMIGVRITPNDAAGSELLIGLFQDIRRDSNVLTVEASRRFGSRWRAYLEGGVFSRIKSDDILYGFRNDDYVRLELAYYF